MEINRLSAEELAYEMEARCLQTGTVSDMRKSLRASRLLERRGSIGTVFTDYPFSFEEDRDAVKAKLAEIGDLLKESPSDPKSKEYLKILTKIEWALGRIDRARPEGNEELDEKLQLRNDLISALGKLTSDEDDEVEEEVDDDDPKQKNSQQQQQQTSLSENRSQIARDLSLPTTSALARELVSHASVGERTEQRERIEQHTVNERYENLAKWGLKFSGERCGASVNSFLERVEELREARGVSIPQLFRSAVELFDGKALLWFRAVRRSVCSWQELVRELKLEFLPPNYDELLLEEIRRRTQGKEESIGVYVATMQNMFGRLSDPISENRKLSMIQRNLAPFYQTQLGLAEPKCVSDLVALGRKLEMVRANVETFAPPPTSRGRHLLEPDLAYVGTEEPRVAVVSQSSQRRRQPMRCYNCDGEGHFANRCSAPRRCYGCGAVGTSRRDCRRCAGNAQRTLGPAGQEVRRN